MVLLEHSRRNKIQWYNFFPDATVFLHIHGDSPHSKFTLHIATAIEFTVKFLSVILLHLVFSFMIYKLLPAFQPFVKSFFTLLLRHHQNSFWMQPRFSLIVVLLICCWLSRIEKVFGVRNWYCRVVNPLLRLFECLNSW